jgi:DNA ligase-3
MSNNTYVTEYAKTARSSCKNTKCPCKPIAKDELRVGVETPSPFDPEEKMTKWYHLDCFFSMMGRARTAQMPSKAEAMGGYASLREADQNSVNDGIATFKCRPSPAKRQKKAPKAEVPKALTPVSPSAPVGSGADQSGSFKAFSRLCASVAEEPSHNGKTKLIKEYLDNFAGDVHTLFKLLLPHKNIDTRTYNMKEKSLGKILATCFGCSASDLQEDINMGDCSSTAAKFFKSNTKVEAQSKSRLTLRQVDQFLDGFSHTGREAEQVQIMDRLLRCATPTNIKWFVRLLFHDLRMGAQAKHVLGALGPKAYETFQSRSDLRLIVSTFTGKGGSAAGGAAQAAQSRQLLTPMKPMLAEALKDFGKALRKSPEGMFAEIKYDGERVQLHKNGSEYRFYSRSLKPVQAHKVKELELYVPRACPHAKSVVLDAEILLVDFSTKTPLPFGTLGKHKKSGFKTACVCLFVFDMLQFNGKDLTKLPLHERRKLMEKHITPIDCRVQLSEMHHVHKQHEMEELMEDAMARGEEGIMLKGRNGVYEPGKRHWFKVKKDYLKGGSMADSADLVCLGGYYGTGRRAVAQGGLVSTFLMGCYDKASKQWKTVCKVGNGFDDSQIDALQKKLLPSMRRMNGGKRNFATTGGVEVPAWLDIANSLKPDFVVKDPWKAPVWEIVGAEFTPSTTHTAGGCSIRFPRVVRVRADKKAADATSVEELGVLVRNSFSQCTAKTSTTSGAGGSKLLKWGVGSGGGLKSTGGAALIEDETLIEDEDEDEDVHVDDEADGDVKMVSALEVVDDQSMVDQFIAITSASEDTARFYVGGAQERRLSLEAAVSHFFEKGGEALPPAAQSPVKRKRSCAELSCDEDEDEVEDEEFVDAPSKKPTRCMYGLQCYRKEPQHFHDFAHPSAHQRSNPLVCGFVGDGEGLDMDAVLPVGSRRSRKPVCYTADTEEDEEEDERSGSEDSKSEDSDSGDDGDDGDEEYSE